MRLRDLELCRILKKLDEYIVDWHSMVELEDAYDIWSWHPGMG